MNYSPSNLKAATSLSLRAWWILIVWKWPNYYWVRERNEKKSNLECRKARLWHGFWSCAQIFPGMYKDYKPLTKSLCLPLRTKTLPLRFITYCFQSSSILPLNFLKFYLFASSSLTMLERNGEDRGERKTANLSRRISSQAFRGEGAPVYKGGWSQFGYPRQEVNVFTLEAIM